MPLKKLTTNTILKKKKNLSQHAEKKKKKCYLPNRDNNATRDYYILTMTK